MVNLITPYYLWTRKKNNTFVYTRNFRVELQKYTGNFVEDLEEKIPGPREFPVTSDKLMVS